MLGAELTIYFINSESKSKELLKKLYLNIEKTLNNDYFLESQLTF